MQLARAVVVALQYTVYRAPDYYLFALISLITVPIARSRLQLPQGSKKKSWQRSPWCWWQHTPTTRAGGSTRSNESESVSGKRVDIINPWCVSKTVLIETARKNEELPSLQCCEHYVCGIPRLRIRQCVSQTWVFLIAITFLVLTSASTLLF